MEHSLQAIELARGNRNGRQEPYLMVLYGICTEQ